MEYYAGIDVSLEASSVCVVDGSGKIVRAGKVPSEPEDLIAWFKALGFPLARIGLEAGPLPQWLFAGLKEEGFAVELLETRHVRDAFKAMPVKTDRNDARGKSAIAKALLAVHAVLLHELNGFERQVRKQAKSDARARLLMTVPGVGAIAGLTYVAATAIRPGSHHRRGLGRISA